MTKDYCLEVFDGVEPDGVGTNFTEIVKLFPLLVSWLVAETFKFDEKYTSLEDKNSIRCGSTTRRTEFARIPTASSSPLDGVGFKVDFEVIDFVS